MAGLLFTQCCSLGASRNSDHMSTSIWAFFPQNIQTHISSQRTAFVRTPAVCENLCVQYLHDRGPLGFLWSTLCANVMSTSLLPINIYIILLMLLSIALMKRYKINPAITSVRSSEFLCFLLHNGLLYILRFLFSPHFINALKWCCL